MCVATTQPGAAVNFGDNSVEISYENYFSIPYIFLGIELPPMGDLILYNFQNIIWGIVAILFSTASQTGLSNRNSSNGCQRYVIAPPRSFDEYSSDFTATTWIQSVEKKLPKCHQIVSYNRSKSAFQLLNINHVQPLILKEFSENPRENLSKQTNATSIVFLNQKIVKNKIFYNPKVYSVIQLKEVKSSPFGPSEVVVNKNALALMRPSFFAAQAANLIPNSVTLGISSYNYENNRVVTGEIEQLEVQELSAIPKILTGFSATNISHPAGFNTWDIDSNWFGALAFEGVDNRYTYRRPTETENTDPKPTFNYDLKVYVVSPTINRDLSMYWLLGTTFLSIGIGPGFYAYNDSIPTQKKGFVITTPFSIGHRTFVTEKIFTQLSINYIAQAPPIVDNQVFKYNGSVKVWFGFGYYFPEGQTLARSVF